MTTGDVDLAGHLFSIKPALGRNDLTHELMPQDTCISHISLDDLKIGVTDGRIQDPDQNFALTGNRIIDFLHG